MTRDEFLALPPEERKRLASLRSREIGKARKAGLPVPPTLGEEFGLGSKKTKPQPIKAEPKAAEPALPAVPKEARPKPEPGVRVAVMGQVVVPCGMGVPPLRTMRGMLHCVHNSDLVKYEEAAKEKGFKKKVSYLEGTKVLGTFFFGGEFPQEKVRAILVGSHPGSVFNFGKVESV